MSISRPTLSLLCSALALALAIPVAAADLPTGSPKSQGLSAERLGRIHGVLRERAVQDAAPDHPPRRQSACDGVQQRLRAKPSDRDGERHRSLAHEGDWRN